jgi:hypothetical protein
VLDDPDHARSSHGAGGAVSRTACRTAAGPLVNLMERGPAMLRGGATTVSARFRAVAVPI